MTRWSLFLQTLSLLLHHFLDSTALDAGKTYLVMGKTTGWG